MDVPAPNPPTNITSRFPFPPLPPPQKFAKVPGYVIEFALIAVSVAAMRAIRGINRTQREVGTLGWVGV